MDGQTDRWMDVGVGPSFQCKSKSDSDDLNRRVVIIILSSLPSNTRNTRPHQDRALKIDPFHVLTQRFPKHRVSENV